MTTIQRQQLNLLDSILNNYKKNGYYNLMKKLRRLIIIFLLFIFYCYVINISNFPSRLILNNDSHLNLRLCPYIKLNGEILTSSNENISKYTLRLSIANVEIKDVEVKLVKKVNVIPLRKFSWIKAIYRWRNGCTVFQIFKTFLEILLI